MEPLKKHGDPFEKEIHQDPARGAEVVASNQPGSKGRRDEDQAEIVRSVSQKPNPNQSDEEATMEPGGDLGRKRTTM